MDIECETVKDSSLIGQPGFALHRHSRDNDVLQKVSKSEPRDSAGARYTGNVVDALAYLYSLDHLLDFI